MASPFTPGQTAWLRATFGQTATWSDGAPPALTEPDPSGNPTGAAALSTGTPGPSSSTHGVDTETAPAPATASGTLLKALP